MSKNKKNRQKHLLITLLFLLLQTLLNTTSVSWEVNNRRKALWTGLTSHSLEM